MSKSIGVNAEPTNGFVYLLALRSKYFSFRPSDIMVLLMRFMFFCSASVLSFVNAVTVSTMMVQPIMVEVLLTMVV